MTIEDKYLIDSTGIMRSSGRLSLMISDHLPWDDDLDRHLDLLEDKLQLYLHFIKSGKVYELHPNDAHRPVEIELVHQYEPNAAGLEFLNLARERLGEMGVHFYHHSLPEGY